MVSLLKALGLQYVKPTNLNGCSHLAWHCERSPSNPWAAIAWQVSPHGMREVGVALVLQTLWFSP